MQPEKTLQTAAQVQVAPALEYGYQDSSSLQYQAAIPVLRALAGDTETPVIVVSIFGPNGELLATASEGQVGKQPIESSNPAIAVNTLNKELLSYGQRPSVIHDVLTNHQVYTGEINNNAGVSYAVVPVLDNHKQVIGAMAAVFKGSVSGGTGFNWGNFLSLVRQNLQPTMLYFLAVSIVIGTTAGLLITRNLRWRLNRITLAASEWGRGNFETEVLDDSRDELQQLTKHLNRMAKQLQTLLSERQALAIVEERNRLARDLHDSVKQQVFSGSLLVRAARKLLQRDAQTASQHLSEAENLMERVQQELDDIIAALRPTALADRGIASVLTDIARDWSRRSGISMQLDVQSDCNAPLPVEEALLRIAQEALANAARHSRATKVDLALLAEPDMMVLRISDNGQGFDVHEVNGPGVGLSSMQERAQALHGTLHVSSSSHGTCIDVRIPVRGDNPSKGGRHID